MSQKNFTNATGNWTVGSDDQINYSSSAKLEGTIQATDFLDADGNSIVIDVSKYLPATFYPEYEYETSGATANKEDVWETTNLSANWLYAPVFQAGRSHFSQQISSVLGLSSNITYGSITGALGGFTEVIALGGISIPASAEDLPFSIDEEEREGLENKTRSIQKAFTVTHETLGRTVEIDKEGIIRANAFTDMDGNPIVDLTGYLKSEDSFLVDYNAERTPLDIVSWNINDTYDGYESDFKISWGPKYYPSILTKLRGTFIETDEPGLGLYCGTGEDSSAVYVNKFGVTTIAPSRVQFMTPTVIMPDATGASSDAKVAIKLERDKASYFKFPIQASDFLDADGKSIIGVSEFISTEGTNNISVGTLDTDGDYSTALGMKGPFGGFVYKNSVGVGMDAKASEMGVAVGWATEARKQGIAVGYNTRAWGDYSTALGPGSIVNLDHEYSVAIGKSASTEESQQVMFGTAPDAPYGKPLNLKTYGTMQASDFLDADGNSIIGAGGDPDWVHNNETNHNLILGWNPSTEFYYNDQVLLGNRVKGQAGSVAIGADADSGLLGVAIGSNAKTGESAVAIGEDATAGDNEFAIGKYISAVNFSGATVKAKDYLDANGNSIKVDLSNYYTSTESNARYQPRGNYQPAGNYQPEGNYPQSTTVNTFVTLTQAQYDALPLKNSSTIYFIKE